MLVQQNQTITLPDHRNLGFAKYGDHNGKVVFFYTNSQGYAKDAELLLLDWGIDLKKITMQVQLWWGEQDKTTPPSIQEHFARQLPKSRIHLQADAGHFGFMNAWGRICDLMNETPDLTCI